MLESQTELTVRDLRRLWKPTKQRLSLIDEQHPTNVRFHRACSWLQQAEQLDPVEQADWKLLSQWFAFNSIYGQWNETEQEPRPDRDSWKACLERLLELDDAQHLAQVLTTHRSLVLRIFEDAYLCRYFWKEPGEPAARRSRKVQHQAYSWYLDKRWIQILPRVLDRIYFLRCQIVHGAATYNSGLNQEAKQNCSELMQALLRAFLLIWIEQGADQDWGPMCYPPQQQG